MKYGAHSLMFAASLTENALGMFDEAKDLGLDGLEVHIGDPSRIPIDAVRSKKEETGLETTFTTMLDKDCNIVSPEPAVREAGMRFLKGCVDVVVELDGSGLSGVIHSAYDHFTGTMRTPDEWRWSVECLREIGEYGQDRGVALGVEPINRYKGYFLNTTEDARRLVDDIDHPNVGLLLDTFHMNVEDKSFYQSFKLAGDRLLHVHLNENDRGVPGTGHVPWDEVFRALDEIGYDGWGVMESFVPEMPEVARMTTTWRKVAPSTAAIIEGGLALFRRAERARSIEQGS